jgi:hypothetical protein
MSWITRSANGLQPGSGNGLKPILFMDSCPRPEGRGNGTGSSGVELLQSLQVVRRQFLTRHRNLWFIKRRKGNDRAGKQI